MEILVPLLCGPSCRKRPISIHFGIYGHAQRLRIPSKQGSTGRLTVHSPQEPHFVPEVATDSISVHAHELVLSQATFTPSQGSVCQSSSIALKTKLKTAVIDFEEVLPVGKGVLEIKFRGTLNETWTQLGTVKWSRSFWAPHQYAKGDDRDSSKRLPYAHLLVETSFQILRETVYHFDLSVLSVLSQSFGSCLKTTDEKNSSQDQMAGFYRSQYTDSKGVKRFMATTQFEAIDARRCFPCWDEPARKATFVVTMIYPSNLMAISNMPLGRKPQFLSPGPVLNLGQNGIFFHDRRQSIRFFMVE